MHRSNIRRAALGAAAAVALSAGVPFQGYAAALAGRPAGPRFAQSAPGQPIFDCTGMQATSARLKAGLPVQEEWIRSTEAQLRAAEDGVLQSKAALQDLALKHAQDLVERQLAMVRGFKDALENTRGMSDINRRRWLDRFDRITESTDRINDAVSIGTAGIAGRNLGQLMQQNRATLQDFIKMVDEAGISDELGVRAAQFAGPAGVAVVETFMVARDVSLAVLDARMNASEAAAARDNLAQMRAAKSTVESRVYELDNIVASSCTQPGPPPNDRILVEGPAETPAAAPPATGGGGGAGTAIKVGVAVAGAGAGAILVKQAMDEMKASQQLIDSARSTPSTTTTTPPAGGGSVTYRAQVTDTCTPGANGNVLAGEIGTPCSRVVGGPCGPAPSAFDFTVANGAVTNQCWLSNAPIVSGTYTGQFLGTTCDNRAVSGPLPGTWTMTCTEGRTRPATHRVTIVVTRVQ